MMHDVPRSKQIESPYFMKTLPKNLRFTFPGQCTYVHRIGMQTRHVGSAVNVIHVTSVDRRAVNPVKLVLVRGNVVPGILPARLRCTGGDFNQS